MRTLFFVTILSLIGCVPANQQAISQAEQLGELRGRVLTAIEFCPAVIKKAGINVEKQGEKK